MEIIVSELRKKPRINWNLAIEWMTKLTNEEIHEWENSVVERITSENIGKKFAIEEIRHILQKEAELIDRDYKFIK